MKKKIFLDHFDLFWPQKLAKKSKNPFWGLEFKNFSISQNILMLAIIGKLFG